MAKTHPLAQIKLFDRLGPEQLQALERIGEFKEYEVGDTIFAEGDPGTHLYCVLDGRVEITLALGDQSDQAPVHVVVPGSVFGEFVMFKAEARTASARAVKPVRIYTVAAEALRSAFGDDPGCGYLVLDNLCRILVGRIRKTTKELKASLMW